METVRNCVYEYRTKQGLTQEELATALGVTRQTIISIEKGNYTPSVLLAYLVITYAKNSFRICGSRGGTRLRYTMRLL